MERRRDHYEDTRHEPGTPSAKLRALERRAESIVDVQRAEALAAALLLDEDGSSASALSAIGARASRDDLLHALDVARRIGKAPTTLAALRGLAPYLDKALICEEAVKLARSLEEKEYREAALNLVFTTVPAARSFDLARDVLAAARAQQDQYALWTCLELLLISSDHVWRMSDQGRERSEEPSEDDFGEVVSAIAILEDERQRARGAMLLAPHVGGQLSLDLLEIGLGIEDEKIRSALLFRLFRSPLRARMGTLTIDVIARVAAKLLEHPASALQPKVWNALTELVRHLTEPRLRASMDDLAQAGHHVARAWLLAAAAARAVGYARSEMLQELVEAGERLEEGDRLVLLRKIAALADPQAPEVRRTMPEVRTVSDADSMAFPLVPLLPEPVVLGTSAPSCARRDDEIVARFVACAERLRDDLARWLNEASPRASMSAGLKRCQWRHGIKVRVVASCDRITVTPAEQTFVWDASEAILEFSLKVPPDAGLGATVLRFAVYIDDVCVATLRHEIAITATGRDSGERRTAFQAAARTAFASYSSEDFKRVLDRIATLRSSAGLDVFCDCLSLRPGEEWKPALEKEIADRDLFLLFWSRSARRSTWVEWEWKTALRVKGLSAVQPHPLDPVREAPPPPELASLHFGDPSTAIRDAR
jgi:hypothetical protein